MKTIDITESQMQKRMARFEDYSRDDPVDPRRRATAALWGGALVSLMAAKNVKGRFADPRLASPARACTGYLGLSAKAGSLAYRNPDALENLLCLEGGLEVRLGPDLSQRVRLERFDMLSIPQDVLHEIRADAQTGAKLLMILNGAPDCEYEAVFQRRAGTPEPEASAMQAINARFDVGTGRALDDAALAARVTRAASMVPYKRSLDSKSAIPMEATEWLTASSVYPLIIPEGHIGRSQHAPLKGLPGLYTSIAECVPNDGPLPHAHFDTQESFFVLDGEWDVTWGFDNEFRMPARPFDLVAMPVGAMRAFCNTGAQTARLFVIIQGQEKMSDTVVYTPEVGEEVRRRYGPEVVEAFRQVNITFDAQRA